MADRPPSRYDTRRDRRRITGLLFALGLVIICIHEASKPANWKWLTELGNRHQNALEEGRDRRSAVRPAEPEEPLAPGEFRLVEHDQPQPPLVAEREPTAEPSLSNENRLTIPKELLRTITDQSAGIRSSERDAYFAFLAKARDLPPRELEQAGNPDTGYAELMNDPERHRGGLVTLSGEMRRFLPLPAGENELGFETLYDGWMYTDDAGKKSPYRVILSEKPSGFPEGEQVRERVRFTGFFFKRYSYDTAHGLHAAPLLIGKRVRWNPETRAKGDSRSGASYIVLGLGCLASAFAAALWWISARDRQVQIIQTRRVRAPTAEAIADLRGVEARDESNFLNELAEQERNPPSEGPH